MSTPDLNDELADRIHGFRHPEVPEELAWERVADRVAPREKRRKGFFWWWWTTLFLLLLVGAATWWVFSNRSQSSAAATPKVKSAIAPKTPAVPSPFSRMAPAEAQRPGLRRVDNDVEAASQARSTDSRLPVTVVPNSGPSPSITDETAKSRNASRIDPLPASATTVIGEPRKGPKPLLNQPVDLPDTTAVTEVGSIAANAGWALHAGLIATAGERAFATSGRTGWEGVLSHQLPLSATSFLEVGLGLRQYRERSALELTRTEVSLYRPGTVDTIFRNVTTGTERVVTTDTLFGTVTRSFGHTNRRTEIGFPLSIGWRWGTPRSGFALAAGGRLGYTVERKGRRIDPEGVVREWAADGDLRFTLTAGAGYRFRPGTGGSFSLRVSAERWVVNGEQSPGWVFGTAMGFRFGG